MKKKRGAGPFVREASPHHSEVKTVVSKHKESEQRGRKIQQQLVSPSRHSARVSSTTRERHGATFSRCYLNSDLDGRNIFSVFRLDACLRERSQIDAVVRLSLTEPCRLLTLLYLASCGRSTEAMQPSEAILPMCPSYMSVPPAHPRGLPYHTMRHLVVCSVGLASPCCPILCHSDSS